SNRGTKGRTISAIGDVQFRGDQLMRQADQAIPLRRPIENTAEVIRCVQGRAKEHSVRYDACRPLIRIVALQTIIGRTMGLPIALRERAAAAPTWQRRTLEIGSKGTSIILRIGVRESTEHVSRTALQRLTRAVAALTAAVEQIISNLDGNRSARREIVKGA